MTLTQICYIIESHLRFRGCLIARRTKDSDSDHGLGPESVRLIADHGLGPRTRSDLLPQTRSDLKNRRLKNLPLMSDSVRSPRCLVGAFDVGLGPVSLRLDQLRRQTQSDRTQSTTIKQPLREAALNKLKMVVGNQQSEDDYNHGSGGSTSSIDALAIARVSTSTGSKQRYKPCYSSGSGLKSKACYWRGVMGIVFHYKSATATIIIAIAKYGQFKMLLPKSGGTTYG
ncbi:hypothetical protein LXL04_000701 [Taraxacum kok-saghyz]